MALQHRRLGTLMLLVDVFREATGFSLGVVFLFVAVAASLDLYREARFRLRRGALVAVAELHDVTRGGMLVDLMRKKGIPAFLRGYRHRSLLYFFGPYLEMPLLVPEEHREEAAAIVGEWRQVAGVRHCSGGGSPVDARASLFRNCILSENMYIDNMQGLSADPDDA